MKRHPLLPIFLIVVVDVLGLTIILPLLPFYAQTLGASATQVGLLISVFSLCSLFSGPLLGRLSDRVGRKPLLLLSQVGTLAGFLVLAGAQTLWVAFLGRIIDGLTAGNLSLAQAYIADVTEPKNRSRSFAIIGIAFGFGFLVGPALSGFLSKYGYQVPILMAAGLSLTSILATAFLLPGGSNAKTASAVEPNAARIPSPSPLTTDPPCFETAAPRISSWRRRTRSSQRICPPSAASHSRAAVTTGVP